MYTILKIVYTILKIVYQKANRKKINSLAAFYS